jgi:Na+-transporting NADH:ubiquinone oxidoreductase subunit C
LLDGDRCIGYALPIRGQGFWDDIAGVIGIDADGETLTGIAFHEHKETPGLGAEIVGPRFRNQFKGKKMDPGERPIGLLPAGAEVSEHQVHAITGATQTCTRLERIMNDALLEWRGAAGKAGR